MRPIDVVRVLCAVFIAAVGVFLAVDGDGLLMLLGSAQAVVGVWMTITAVRVARGQGAGNERADQEHFAP